MNNKRILVTGGCGFIGHHFVEHLLVNTDYHMYFAISCVLILWAILQYFRGVYLPL